MLNESGNNMSNTQTQTEDDVEESYREFGENSQSDINQFQYGSNS